jgi:hypothetical protein
MEFLKAHYEKIILSIVLLGLAAAAALMPMKVAEERDKEEARKTSIVNPRVTEMPPVPLTNEAVVIARTEQPERLKLSGEHNLFNPVRWQKGPDGGIYKATEAGPNALQITEITPLHLQVKFEEVIPEPNGVRYRVSVLNEQHRANGRPTPRDAGVGEKNNMFTIEKVIGNEDNPAGLQLVLAGEKEPIQITREKGYDRVVGYSADLRHPLEKKEWKNLKPKDELTFGGETYNIVAITQNEVVLSAKSNKKQTVLEYKPPQK